jgi:hypothetical protein
MAGPAGSAINRETMSVATSRLRPSIPHPAQSFEPEAAQAAVPEFADQAIRLGEEGISAAPAPKPHRPAKLTEIMLRRNSRRDAMARQNLLFRQKFCGHRQSLCYRLEIELFHF